MNLALVLLIAAPFAAGLLVVFPGRFSRILRWVISLVGVLATGGLLVWNIISKVPGFTIWNLMPSSATQFSTSPTTIFIAAGFILLWLVVTFYSFAYFKKGEEAQTEYYALTLFMLGSLIGVLFTNDLIFIYLFWEIAAVTTWRLVGFGRSEEKISIATKTLIINFVGSALMLVGFVLLYFAFGSFNLLDIKGNQMPLIAGIMIFAGIFAKSAVIPLYIWLPDAHPAAPSPTSALLSGAIVKVGLIAYLKIFTETFQIPPAWQVTVLAIVLTSSLVAGGAALVDKDFKRILAYSTVSQVTFIFAGLIVVTGLAGITGGVIYLVAHCLAKGALFLGYGIIEHKTGERNITSLGQLAKKFPVLFTAVMIASLSIIGLPPLLGFFAKFSVIYAVLADGHIIIATGLIIASILTLLYMLRLFSTVFLQTGNADNSKFREPLYLSILVLLLSLSLLGGSFAIKPLLAYLGGG